MVVVVNLAGGQFLLCEADAEAAIEVAAIRRHPFELPTHAPEKAFDLGQRCAGDRDEGDVAMGKVHVHAVAMICHEGAAWTTLLPSRAEHEVLHQQLAPPIEQVGECLRAFGSVEDIVLLDAYPRKRTALAGDLFAQARQLLFARQQRPAFGNPSVSGNDGMVYGGSLREWRCSWNAPWLE